MKYGTNQHSTTLIKVIFTWLVLTSVGNSAAFSLKSFLNDKYSALKRLFVLKKQKDALEAQQSVSEQKNSEQSKTLDQTLKDPILTTDIQEVVSRPIITVWVHGTSKNSLLGLLKKEGPRGIFPIENVGGGVKSKSVAWTLIRQDEQKFPSKSFYLFRWSGKLSYKEREREARNLYKSLEEIISHYKTLYGVTPYVRIVAHSHGGNVALNLAKVKDADSQFVIDELILLACPVQDTTEYLVGDTLFKKVYALYSSKDIVQVAAPQGLGFSGRHFSRRDNVVQVAIKIRGKSPGHFDFVKPEFMKYLPEIIQHLERHGHHAHKVLKVNTHGAVYAV